MTDTVAAVLYYRVSTEEQSKRGFSLPEQRKECLARAHSLARQRGANLQVYEFEDAASGEVLERPGLEACREFLRSTPAHFFICLDPDRFSRSLFNQLLVTEEIEKRGVELQFVQHNYEATPEGRLFYQMRGAISEYEKSKIWERTSRGRRGKLAAGGIPNAVEPWGYIWDKQAKALRVDPDKQAWVIQVFEWFADGWPYQRIADKLSEFGVAPPRRGRSWYRNAVSRILQNPVYAGRLQLNKGNYVGLTPLRKVPREKRRALTHTVRPPEEWVTIAVPAMIPEDLWQRCQALMSGRRRLSQPGVGLLSGLCTCGLCRQPVHYVRNHGRRYLRCYGRYPHLKDARPDVRRTEPCKLAHFPAEPIEGAVWQQVWAWLQDPHELRQEQQRQFGRSVASADDQRLTALRSHLATQEEQYRRAFELAVKGLAPQGYEAELRRLQAEVQAVQMELESRTGTAATPEPGGHPLGLDQLAEEVEARLDDLDIAGRQSVSRMLIRRIQVWPDRWEYLLR